MESNGPKKNGGKATGGAPTLPAGPVGLPAISSGTRPLRVLFIVAQPQSTPAISVHANLMRFLDPERVEVHAIYPKAADTVSLGGGRSVLDVLPQERHIQLQPVEFGPARRAGAGRFGAELALRAAPIVQDALRVRRMVAELGVDVIHCEYGMLNGPYGLMLARTTAARYLVHLHAPFGSWLRPPSAYAIRQADAVIPVSDWVARGVAAAGVPDERIHTVLNGIDLSRWDPEVSGETVRRELNVSQDAPLVVQIAQLAAWKRQHLLIDAFRRVVERHSDARLLLVGEEQGPAEGYRRQLQDQVSEAGLEERVIFAGRRVDVDQVLAAADIFCLPSVDDPCALAHLEAMAMRRPVVSVRAGGAPELISDGKTGLLGPADDPEALAANLSILIDAPRLREEMGDRGRRRVAENFTVQRMAAEMEEVYRSLAAGSRPSRAPIVA